ncbi:MAG: hypothetical protein JRD68_02650 [Deltaproteobacteria bacterium]|nr:hypothetical protein [Deltaproteobacteria bacterium]
MYIRSDNGPEFVEKALKKWLTPAFSLAVERLEIRMAGTDNECIPLCISEAQLQEEP